MCFAAGLSGDRAMKSSQEYRSNVVSCIRNEARRDIVIRINATVIRITRPRPGIRSIVPIGTRDQLRQNDFMAFTTPNPIVVGEKNSPTFSVYSRYTFTFTVAPKRSAPRYRYSH